MPDPSPIQEQRATVLSVLLPIVAMSALLAMLFAACGGFAIYFFAAVTGTAALGYVHYWLWGRALDHEVAGEREEEELRASIESEKSDANGEFRDH
jgi:hypothetical protein